MRWFLLLLVFFALVIVAYKKLTRVPPRITRQRQEPLYRTPAISAEPGPPAMFSYKCTWFAIRTTDTQAVADAIGLERRKDANWETGVANAYVITRHAFVSPPLDGWVFAMGEVLAFTSDHDVLLKIATDLSKQFGEVFFFGSYRVVGYVAWIHAVDGNVLRAYVYCEGVRLNIGEFTPEEMQIIEEGKKRHGPLEDGEDLGEWLGIFSDEDDVLRIAEKWNINPKTLEDPCYQDAVGVGIFGHVPK